MTKLGLALGSGGARGWCHIGVIRALEARGLTPDVIAGCSMGALVGAFYASGHLDALEDWALSLTPSRLARLLDPRVRGGGLIFGQSILEMLDELGLPKQFDQVGKPFLAVATDLQSGRELWMRTGGLHDAVRASVAIPGIIAPHAIDGRWYADGGLTDPVPVSGARALGADVVIAVNPNARRLAQFLPKTETTDWAEGLPRPMAQLIDRFGIDTTAEAGPPEYLDVVNAAIDILTDRVRRARMAGDPPQVLLDANLTEMSVVEMHRAREAIDEGRRMVEDAARALDALL